MTIYSTCGPGSKSICSCKEAKVIYDGQAGVVLATRHRDQSTESNKYTCAVGFSPQIKDGTVSRQGCEM